ncbi:MAG: DUF1684 domain-containing protein [Chloroflexi bacterium]|nr:MAG: DUF1684 domain-containing protein [Chloroflexota bacterium]
MDTNKLLAHRREKDQFMKAHPQSPLKPEHRANFNGLAYYEPNPALDLRVTVRQFEHQEIVKMQTTTGEPRDFRRYGEFTFNVDGQEARLTIYWNAHGFFLPFVDAGAGNETYGAGRYLEPELLDDNSFHIDFNLAYNPFCAYNDAYSCPLPPPENRLNVHIRAGEKNFK